MTGPIWLNDGLWRTLLESADAKRHPFFMHKLFCNVPRVRELLLPKASERFDEGPLEAGTMLLRAMHQKATELPPLRHWVWHAVIKDDIGLMRAIWHLVTSRRTRSIYFKWAMDKNFMYALHGTATELLEFVLCETSYRPMPVELEHYYSTYLAFSEDVRKVVDKYVQPAADHILMLAELGIGWESPHVSQLDVRLAVLKFGPITHQADALSAFHVALDKCPLGARGKYLSLASSHRTNVKVLRWTLRTFGKLPSWFELDAFLEVALTNHDSDAVDFVLHDLGWTPGSDDDEGRELVERAEQLLE